MKIALCSELDEAMQSRRFADAHFCAQFPGAAWMPEFAHLATLAGYEVIPGPEAKGSDFLVIQEGLSQDGERLLSKGSHGSVLFSLESPLYAPLFYKKVEELFSSFDSVLLFQGIAIQGTEGKLSERVYFPSFELEKEAPIPTPWKERRFISAVLSNKHYAYFGKQVPKDQLQDDRFAALDYFAEDLGLYGHGWYRGCPLPPRFEHFRPILEDLDAHQVNDKIETLSKFKFNLCFENMAYPGYITEKIFDAFQAGTIPVYLGAPDIETRIPPELFIDARQFKDTDLRTFLEHFPEAMALRMIRGAQQWLATSAEATKYTYKAFALSVLSHVLSKGPLKDHSQNQG